MLIPTDTRETGGGGRGSGTATGTAGGVEDTPVVPLGKCTPVVGVDNMTGGGSTWEEVGSVAPGTEDASSGVCPSPFPSWFSGDVVEGTGPPALSAEEGWGEAGREEGTQRRSSEAS